MRPRPRGLVAALLAAGAWFAPATAFADRVQAVTAGESHTCALTDAGGVRCWGINTNGDSEAGDPRNFLTPTDVPGLTSGVAALAAGVRHTCVVTAGGGVKCWGANSLGQLGDGTTSRRYLPTDVVGLTSGVSGVAAGAHHTCALTSAGGVMCWGANYDGQLGDGTTTDRPAPVAVSGLASGVTAVAGGERHTCALMAAGGLKCWGWNIDGQLGDGTISARTTPVDVTGLSDVTAVATGRYHTCALTSTGALKCWGSNEYGQLGNGVTGSQSTPTDVSGLTTGVSGVACGDAHSCAVTSDGGVKCWGAAGMVGDGSTVARTLPAGVAGLTAGVVRVAAGNHHTCAVTTGGGVKCWGANTEGQVGDGTTTKRTSPADVFGLILSVSSAGSGGQHTCALTSAGGVKCWGRNNYGQLGDGTVNTSLTPVDVVGLTSGVVALSVGTEHTCAVTAAGGLKCWGSNGFGRLGTGDWSDRLTPADVPGLTSGVASVSAGGGHTCAVTSGGGVKCWGNGSNGQLGDGTWAARGTPGDVTGLTSGVASVVAGEAHTCAVTTAGALKCWGHNINGKVGDGTTYDRPTPTSVSGLTSGVAAAAAGYNHTCALTTGGGLKCWGGNSAGQLGDGTTDNRLTPTSVSGLTGGVTGLSAGQFHTCAWTASSGAKCWGMNESSQLGDGTTEERHTPTDVVGLASGVAAVAAGGDHTCGLTTGGGLKCWGGNDYGQLADPTSAPRVSPVRTKGFGWFDYDWDDLADVAVYRPSTGTWFSLDSSRNNWTYRITGWGIQAWNDTPAPGDYDGDGLVDPTVYRPSTGTWFTLESRFAYTTWTWFGWGAATDTLVPGDYDGDERTDAAVYRAATGTWYIRPSSGATAWNVVFGQPGDEPVAGDFDGDGQRDPAVYRPATGTWFWLKSSSGFTAYEYRGWGQQVHGDVPAPGDFDGDGKTDPCVFRPPTGTWFVLESHTGYATMSYFGWGMVGDTVVPADFDGDGRTDGAVYRLATGRWYVRPSSGASPWEQVFGQPGDVPLIWIR